MPPQTSVIIPVLNDADGLRRTVDSLVAQSLHPSEYEIIIADNGSTDGTLPAAGDLAHQNPDLVRVVEELVVRGSYAARNRGIEVARGDVLCFLDAGVTVPPDYLARVHATLAREGADYLGCRVVLVAERATLTALFNSARGFPVQRYLEGQHFAPTCCLSIRRYVVQRVGGFDGRLESSGDLEFGQRVHQEGFRQVYADDVVVRHPARWRYVDLARKANRLGRGVAQVRYFHASRFPRLHRRYLQFRAYLPERPGRLARQFGAAGVPIGPLQALLLAFWHIPLRGIHLFGFVHETLRLWYTRADRR